MHYGLDSSQIADHQDISVRSVESPLVSCQPLWVLVGSHVYVHWADTRISMWGQHGHFARLTVARGINLES